MTPDTRLAELTAILERVRALADEWDEPGTYEYGCRTALLIALDAPAESSSKESPPTAKATS